MMQLLTGLLIMSINIMNTQRIAELRDSLQAENISYGELIEIDSEADRLGVIVTEEMLAGDTLDAIEDCLRQSPKVKKVLFKIKDQDDSQLMVNSHYYKWLLEQQPRDIHSIHTKMAYLESEGFVLLDNSISSEDSQRLRYIEQFYFDQEIKPTLQIK